MDFLVPMQLTVDVEGLLRYTTYESFALSDSESISGTIQYRAERRSVISGTGKWGTYM